MEEDAIVSVLIKNGKAANDQEGGNWWSNIKDQIQGFGNISISTPGGVTPREVKKFNFDD
jgi:hypothetical protein